MNLRKIFNLDKAKNEPPQEILLGQLRFKPLPKYDPENDTPDILGQGGFRLWYKQEAIDIAHTEKYEVAMNVVEEFKTIHDYGERLAFWYAHPCVFGYAGVVVFDTQEKKYGPYYSRPYDAFSVDFSEPEGHYRVAWIFPDNNDDFLLFSKWCVEKFLRWDAFNVKKEDTHWREIKTYESPRDYIEEQLDSSKEVRDKVVMPDKSTETIFISAGRLPGFGTYTDEVAERFFFSYGRQAATTGRESAWNLGELFMMLRGVLACPLSIYANIIHEYTYGYETTKRVSFLKKQLERLNKGEDEEAVRFPASSPNISNHSTSQTDNMNSKSTDSSHKAAFSGVKSNDQTSPQSDRYQNFLNEIVVVEEDMVSRGDQNIQRHFAPLIFTPVATLWESIDEDKINEARLLYKDEVKDKVEFSVNQLANIYVRSCEVAIQKQPDRRIALSIEYRDKYVSVIDENYTPIQNWYYQFWEEQTKSVQRINDLEAEVFYFCFTYNKPFMVGLKLLQNLYSYCSAVNKINEEIDKGSTPINNKPNSVEKGISDVENVSSKSKRINVEAKSKHSRIYSKYDKYIVDKFTHGAAIQKLVHDFKFEYNPNNAANRKKAIQLIIRNRDKPE